MLDDMTRTGTDGMTLTDISNFLLELEAGTTGRDHGKTHRQQNKIDNKVEHAEIGGTSQRESKKNSYTIEDPFRDKIGKHTSELQSPA